MSQTPRGPHACSGPGFAVAAALLLGVSLLMSCAVRRPDVTPRGDVPHVPPGDLPVGTGDSYEIERYEAWRREID